SRVATSPAASPNTIADTNCRASPSPTTTLRRVNGFPFLLVRWSASRVRAPKKAHSMPVIGTSPAAWTDELRVGQAIAAVIRYEGREGGDARIGIEPVPKVGAAGDLGQ